MSFGLAGDIFARGADYSGKAPLVNNPPTDITLSSSAVSESGGVNAVVGAMEAVDPDIGDSHTFTLVAGAGDTNNASFNVNGAQLRCNDPSVLGAGTYSVRIQADDGVSTPFSKAFTINVITVLGGVIMAGPIDSNISETISTVIAS